MSPDKKIKKQASRRGRQSGFSLLEMLLALVIMLAVTAVVMTGMNRMMQTQATVANRTEMHSSVRSATEVLQQEIGQAGRVALPVSVTLSAAVATLGSHTVGVSSTAGMFANEKLVIDTGDNEETVTATAVDTTLNTITAIFTLTHLANVPVQVAGAFASGIVPKSATNGSTDFILKLYGDVNDDGNMVYVEYTCDTAGGNLYRQVVPYDALPSAKVAPTLAMIILSNVLPNPPDPGTGTPAACFKYQEKTVTPDTYVVDVSVTLTVQTQIKDPQTNQFQQETKALLNVSPRNIFDGWQLASAGQANRIQPMPATVANLLP